MPKAIAAMVGRYLGKSVRGPARPLRKPYHLATLPSLGAALEAVTAVAAAVAAVAAIRGVATRAALKTGADGACAAVERRRAIVMGAREGMLLDDGETM